MAFILLCSPALNCDADPAAGAQVMVKGFMIDTEGTAASRHAYEREE